MTKSKKVYSSNGVDPISDYGRTILEKLEDFMLESNKIEGENRLNPFDSEVAQAIYALGFEKFEDITGTHKSLTHHLKVSWSGKWRTVNVRVGNYIAPDWSQVPELMAQFWANWNSMDSWEAHNQFEKIHGFQDFNGRMGRLIWLSKAVREGYDFSIPFLHKYYYQTLSHLQK